VTLNKSETKKTEEKECSAEQPKSRGVDWKMIESLSQATHIDSQAHQKLFPIHSKLDTKPSTVDHSMRKELKR
jgi:hypothetical protein